MADITSNSNKLYCRRNGGGLKNARTSGKLIAARKGGGLKDNTEFASSSEEGPSGSSFLLSAIIVHHTGNEDYL